MHPFLQKHEWSNVNCSGPPDTFDHILSLDQRLIEQVAAVIRQEIENHQRYGYLCDQGRRGTLTAQTLLQQRKWKNLTIFKSDDFAISDQSRLQLSSCFDDFRKLMSNVVQRARIERCTAVTDVQLPADAVVLVFNVKGIWKRGKNFILCFGGCSQHEFHRPKHGKRKLIQLAALRMNCCLTDIPKHHIGAPNRIRSAIE